VVRIVDGDRYVAVASHRGSLTNPSWYANLVAHPRVRLQDGATVKEFAVREVSGDEKQHYWTSPSGSGRRFPNTDGLQLAATSRSWSSNPSPPEQQPRELARSRVSGLTRLVEQLPHIPYSAVRQAFSCVRARLSVETLSLRYPGAVVW
jgi:deazaflavin-dependent oxidoreductase (nitroreductase family)